MLVMSVMRQHNVIRRYNVWEESFLSDNCTYNVVSLYITYMIHNIMWSSQYIRYYTIVLL